MINSDFNIGMERNDDKNQANKDLFGDVNQELGHEKNDEKEENVSQKKLKNGNRKSKTKEVRLEKSDDNLYNIVRINGNKEYAEYYKFIQFEIVTYHGAENSNSSYNEGNTRKIREFGDIYGDRYTSISALSMKRNLCNCLKYIGYEIGKFTIELENGKYHLPKEKTEYIDLRLLGYADMNDQSFRNTSLHMTPSVSLYPSSINTAMHTSGPYRSRKSNELVNSIYHVELDYGNYMIQSIILDVRQFAIFDNTILHYEDLKNFIGRLMHCLYQSLYGSGNHANYLPAVRTVFVLAFLSKSSTNILHVPFKNAFKLDYENRGMRIDINVFNEGLQKISGGLASGVDLKPKLSFGISKDIITNSDDFTNYMISKDNVYFYLIKPDEINKQNNFVLPYTPHESLELLRDYIVEKDVFQWLYKRWIKK